MKNIDSLINDCFSRVIVSQRVASHLMHFVNGSYTNGRIEEIYRRIFLRKKYRGRAILSLVLLSSDLRIRTVSSPSPGIRNRESMRNWKIADSEGQSSPVTCEFWESREVEWVTPSPSLHKNTLTRCDIHFLLSWVVPRRWASRKIEKFQIKMLHCVFHTRRTLSSEKYARYFAFFSQFWSNSMYIIVL